MATVPGTADKSEAGQVQRLPVIRRYRSKRALDVVAASIGLLVAAPLAAIIALLIKLSSPGPVLFKQERIGKDGKPVLDPNTNKPRMGKVNVDIPLLRVAGYVMETPDGRLDTGTFARAAETDEEFSSLFQIEPPRVEDTTYEGCRVRKFSFEFIIKKGGESS